MAVTLKRARTLCSKDEFKTVFESTRKRLETHSALRLRQLIGQARKLRDKFRSLADRQKREARRKEQPRGKRHSEGNAATRAKQQLFTETMERFEKALAARMTETTPETTAANKAAKAGTKAKKKATAKATPKKSTTGKKATTAKKATNTRKTTTGKKPVAQAAARVEQSEKPAVATEGEKAKKKKNRSFLAQAIEAAKNPLAARQTRRLANSDGSVGKRKENRTKEMNQPKIHGHVSGRTKRSQAKRDAK